MAQIIQIKRRVPGTGKPAAGTGATQVREVELAASISAVAATGVAELYIGDGSFVHDLVSSARQVELDGAQTIIGAKTIGAAGSLTTPVANLHINGGSAGYLLSTDGSGVNSWIAPPAAGIPSFSTGGTYAIGAFVSYGGHIYRAIAANGPGTFDPTDWDKVATLSDFPIDEFSTGATYVAGDLVIRNGYIYRANTAVPAGAWDPADWDAITGTPIEDLEVKAPISGDGLTVGTALGVTMATTAQVDTGTDTTYPISSAVLKSQIVGGTNGVASLTTTNKLLVPAINELKTEIGTMTGGIHLVGTYDVPGDEITAVPGHEPLDTQALPAAAPANEGWYVIVDTGGTGINNAPHVAIAAGDWLVSTGSTWVHVPLAHAPVTASGVGLTTVDSQTWTNVQQAIAGLLTRANTAGNTAILADHVSVLGDGTSATATDTVGLLRVGLVDGGAY